MPSYIETFRCTVSLADCDHLGHMNVQHYLRAVSDGMFCLQLHLGLTLEEVKRRKISFAAVHSEMDFHRELYAGDVIALESTVLELGNKSGTFHHRLKNIATNEIVMSTKIKAVLLDLETRKAAVIPEDIRKAAAAKFSGDLPIAPTKNT
jgi:acyl-CoA thioester hydrolase